MCRLVGYLGEQDANSFLLHCLTRPDTRRFSAIEQAHYGSLTHINKNVPTTNQVLNFPQLETPVYTETPESCKNPDGDITTPKGSFSRCFMLDNKGNIEHLNYPIPLIFADKRLNCDIEQKTNKEFLKKTLKLDLESETIETAMMYRKEFSMGIISHSPSKKIVVIRHGGPPLIIGFKNDGLLITSDISDIIDFTSYYRVLEDREIVVLSREGARFVTLDGRPLRRVLYGLEEDTLCAKILTMDNVSSQEQAYEDQYTKRHVHVI